MSWDAFAYPHRVSIRARRRGGGMGGGHAPARTVRAEVRDEQRLVRNIDGAEVVSSTQVTVALDVVAPVESLVTVWPGTSAEREAQVLSVARDDNRDVDLDSFQTLSLQ